MFLDFFSFIRLYQHFSISDLYNVYFIHKLVIFVIYLNWVSLYAIHMRYVIIFIYCTRSLCVEPFQQIYNLFFYVSILDDFTNVCFKILTILCILDIVLRGKGRVLFVRSCVYVLVHYMYNLTISCSKLFGLMHICTSWPSYLNKRSSRGLGGEQINLQIHRTFRNDILSY